MHATGERRLVRSKFRFALEHRFPSATRRWTIFWRHRSRYQSFAQLFLSCAARFTVDKLLTFQWYTPAPATPRDHVPHRPRLRPMRRVRARPVATLSGSGFSRKAGRTLTARSACAHAGMARLCAMHGGAGGTADAARRCVLVFGISRDPGTGAERAAHE